MKHKRYLIKLGLFFSLCLAVLLALPGMPVKATETEAAEYELNFTPGTGLQEELDKGNTDYGYLDMGSHANGEAKQAVYQALEEIADSLWGCQEDLTPVDGESYALLATIHADGLDLTMEELIEVYLMFKNDHPVYYYLSNTVTVSGTDLLVLTDVTDGGDRTAVMESTLEDYIEGYAELTDGDTIYEVAKAIHDRLIGRISYSYEEDGVTPEDAYWAHSIMGAVIKHEGVCETYAKTYQMLLNYYGIDNVYVTGIAGGDNHAWNMVKLDDDLYYYVDATWNDTASTEQYFACGQDFAKEHTAHTPEGEGSNYLYPLPEAAEDNYIKKVAVYQEEELLGNYSSFSKAFEAVTDENGSYRFEVIGSTTEQYSLPAGEWPKAKLLELTYSGNTPGSEYYTIVSLVFTGDTYLNSDVKFTDVSLGCSVSDYAEDNQPTLYAKTYTMYFDGIGNNLGGKSVIISEEEVYQLGLRIEGPEATLVSDASDRFEMFESDVTLGTVYMNSWFLVRGGSFICDTLIFSEEATKMEWSSFYNAEILFDVENVVVAADQLSINNEYPNENNSYRIGSVRKADEADETEVYLYIRTTAGTGKKLVTDITIEEIGELIHLSYIIKYTDVSEYTVEELNELCREAEKEGDSSKWNFYYGLSVYITNYMERYPSDSPEKFTSYDELLAYKGTLINIGTSNLDKVSINYDLEKEYLQGGGASLEEYLGVDADGNVSRAKDEVILIEDNVLKRAKFFNRTDVSYVIPENVTEISVEYPANHVFAGVSQLTITKNVEKSDSAEWFFGYNDLAEIIVDEDNKAYASLDGILYNKDLTELIACPSRKTGTVIIPEGVTSLGYLAFSNGCVIEKLVLPKSLEVLEDGFSWSTCEEIEINSDRVVGGLFGYSGKRLTFGFDVNYIGEKLSYAGNIESISILNPYVELASDAFAEMNAENVIVYGYEGSTAEEFVETYGEVYGLVFSALPGPVPTPKPTVIPTPEVTPDPTPEVTPDPTPEVTPTTAPSATPTTAPSATPTTAPSAIPTATPVPTATATPTPKPTAIPTPPPASREDIEACLYNGEYYAMANEDVAVALNGDPDKLYEHWLNIGKAEGRSASLVFDAKYYLEVNPDVAAVVGENNYEGAYEHFVTSGLEEGRESSPVFDVKYYLRSNTDVAEAFAYDYVKAANHFNTNALAEGRSGSGNFDYTVYRFCNTDVAELYREETRGYYIHYINHGRAEGRTAGFGTNEEIVMDTNAVSYRIFDKDYYLENYPVLARTVGTTEDALYRYWLREGISLGHVASPVFNPTEYLQINTDVAEAVGSDLEAATSHFLNYGIYEGRTGVWEFDYTVYKYCNTDVVEVFGEDIVGYYFHYVKYGRAEGRTAKLQ